MPESQFFEIIFLAAIAGIVLFRLYMVLGRRTGHERPPEQYRLNRRAGEQTAPPENVVPLPDRTQPRPQTGAAGAFDPVSRGLLDIKLADRKFETDHFLSGARAAYETIVTAFAAGNRAALKPLLSDEVYAAFDGVIAGHEERKEKVNYTFVGFSEVKAVHAEMKAQTAEITVAFGAKYISTISEADGSIVDGDPKTVREVTDVWTFARDVNARDPNWMLIATSGGQP